LKTLRTVSLVSLLALAACAEHRVDTFSEWCEQITGVDLEEKYSPFWAVIFSVSFDGKKKGGQRPGKRLQQGGSLKQLPGSVRCGGKSWYMTRNIMVRNFSLR